jgi:hypothetical protein
VRVTELQSAIVQSMRRHQEAVNSGEAFGNRNMYRKGVGRGSSGFGEIGA